MTDQEALSKIILERSEEAFTVIFNRHVKMVEAVCRRVLRDNAFTADVTQSVFILLYQKASSLSPKVSLGGWLHNAARLVALQQNRVQEKQRLEELKVGTMIHDNHETETEKVWRELKPFLDDAIAQLPIKLKETLVLCYLGGMSHKQAAENLNCAVNVVSKRISRALPKLRELLKQKGITVSLTVLSTVLATKTMATSSVTSFSSLKTSLLSGEIPLAANIPLNLIAGVSTIMTMKKIIAITIITISILGAGVYGTNHILNSNLNAKKSNSNLSEASKANPNSDKGGKKKELEKELINKKTERQGIEFLKTYSGNAPKKAKIAKKTPAETEASFTNKYMQLIRELNLAKTDQDRHQSYINFGIAISWDDFQQVMADCRQKHGKRFPNMYHKEYLLNKLLEKWAEKDKKAVAKYLIHYSTLAGLPNQQAIELRNVIVNDEWLKKNPDLIKAILEHPDLPPIAVDTLKRIQAIYDNPKESLEELLENTDESTPNRQFIIMYYLKICRLKNPDYALSWVEKNLNGDLKTQGLLTVFPSIVQKNKSKAWDLIQQFPLEKREKPIGEYISAIILEHPIEAIKLTKEIKSIRAYMTTSIGADLPRAVELWAMEDLLGLTEFFKPNQILNFFDERIMIELARQYALRSPQDGIDLGNSYETPKHRQLFFNSFFGELSKDSPAKALDLLFEAGDDFSEQESMTKTLVQSWSAEDPEAALNWLEKRGGKNNPLHNQILIGWAEKSFDDAIEHIKINNIECGDDAYGEFARMLIMRKKINEAEKYLKKIIDQKNLEHALDKCSLAFTLFPNYSKVIDFIEKFEGNKGHQKLLIRYGTINIFVYIDAAMDSLSKVDLRKHAEGKALTQEFLTATSTLETKISSKKMLEWAATLDWTREAQATKEGFDSLQAQIIEPAFEKWLEKESEQASAWLRNTQNLEEGEKQKIARKLNIEL